MDFRIDEFDVFEKGDIMETIRNVDVNRLHDFKNHPFKVEMNTELCELMRSIEKEGVLVPLLVRNNPYGERWNQTVDRAMISGVAEEEIMGVKHDLKEEEHVSFRGITKFGNPLLFYSKNNCNGKRKTEKIRWIICYDIQCRYIGFIKPNNVENNYEYGESMKKLVILRGNSGSGKTTVARALQRKIGFNTMLISQDEIRRNMLWVKDGIDTKALPLMIELLKYGNEHSAIVILEGIMYDEWYSPLFNVANELYDANVYSYYFDIPFEETVRRHQTRSKSQEFGEEHMRQWWREKDFSSVLKEEIISCEMDADGICRFVRGRIENETGYY